MESLNQIANESNILQIEPLVTGILLYAKDNHVSLVNEKLEELINEQIGHKSILTNHTIKNGLEELLPDFGHAPAYVFVLGYDPDNEAHIRNTFNGSYKGGCVGRNIADSNIFEQLEATSLEDNAILVSKDGRVIGKNVQLTNVDPRIIKPEIDISQPDIYREFGFSLPVHTRHFAALVGSYNLPDTMTVTLSESGHIRIYKEGSIIYSNVKNESTTYKPVGFCKDVLGLVNRVRTNYDMKLDSKLDQLFLKSSNGDYRKKEKIRQGFKEILRQYGHNPAYIVVLNYNQDNPEHTRHIFNGNRLRNCIGRQIYSKSVLDEFIRIGFEDNAVLVDQKDLIRATNAQLVNLDPNVFLQEHVVAAQGYSPKDLPYKYFGFAEPVHTRNMSALIASSVMPGTVILTLSENGIIRSFMGGKILYSTHTGENKRTCLYQPMSYPVQPVL